MAGPTAARGYGGPHQKLRATWEPAVHAGQAWCHAIICLKPSRWIQPGTPWNLGHTADRSAWTGPEHEQCNKADGARRGNQMRSPGSRWRPPPVIPVCAACGKQYFHAARSCEICGGHYHPNHGPQRTCSRKCGVVLQRKNRLATGWLPKAQRPKPRAGQRRTYILNCQQCGEPFTARMHNAKYCSLKCRNASRFPSLRYCACGQQLAPGRHKCDDCKTQPMTTSRRW